MHTVVCVCVWSPASLQRGLMGLLHSLQLLVDCWEWVLTATIAWRSVYL